uniref:Natural cytotoxicity triggering receptor 1 cytotoxicity receptor, NKp46, NK.2A n=1 Tax=Siphoviridae sp. ctxMM9 TaxID=2827973 RepID=A0A8S5T6E5_9CAUD|nr:MAG TPA: natural cytotoxicity triggering receptor 1 cytotoxicity receptor, NKp46, NK.2A [Siphoviridae sp. ctxMM9]
MVTYQWHKKTDARAENELGEQGKQSSYAVPDNDRGIYYCTVTNTRNKDTKSIDGEHIDVRAEPKSPTEVTITAEQTEDGNLKLTAVDTGTIGVPYFQWTCS